VIPVPSDVKVWLASGVTDMRRGMNGLALQVQQVLQRDPHAGDLYVFRGRRGDLERFPVWLNRDSQGRRNRRVLGKRFGICESFHGQTLFVGLARAGGRGS